LSDRAGRLWEDARGGRGPLPAALALAVWALLGAGCGRGESARAAPPAARPDVVLVTIDTWRADAAGFAGNREVETPTLDRLAATGLVFSDARAHNVVTLPSHANLLTGLYPFQHGVRDNSGYVLDAGLPTLATLLRSAGYATGAFVGAYPLDSRFGLANGFEVYDDGYRLGSEGSSFTIAERRGDEVVAAALAWWREAAGKPRLLWVHLYDPHASYSPPEPFAARYARRPYLGEVAAADSFLAPLLRPHLEGDEPPAFVVVTSDHGEALGDHGELTHGLFAYEATLRVPLLVWGAGVAPGRDARAARHVDVLPTILARLGIESPRRLPGRSLLAPAVASDCYFEAFSTALNRGWAPLRGLVRAGKKAIDLPLPELYDLARDPLERTNLAPSAPGELEDLLGALPRESAWPPPRRAPTSEEARQLASLGYAVGRAEPRSAHGPADDPKRLIAIDRKLHEVVDLFARGRFEEAVGRAREVIAERPESPEAYDHLALALRELERHEEAIAALGAGLERAAVKESLARQLGMALAEVGRAAEAVAVLEPLAGDGDPETLRVLASALSDAGDPARALALLERARALAPSDPRLLEATGTAELRRDRPAEAKLWLERALARNDRLATAWNTLGVALFRLEGPRAALPAWQKALALDPALWDALYNLGLVAASAGERETAVGALRRFAAEAPRSRYAPDIAKARAVLRELGA
jgi:arylsulfatase A-like enzyme/Tfp pilus assembly protein PilF